MCHPATLRRSHVHLPPPPPLPRPDLRAQGTPEQKALVAQVIKAKDFYEVLGVSKDAGESDIKKAYKKVRVVCMATHAVCIGRRWRRHVWTSVTTSWLRHACCTPAACVRAFPLCSPLINPELPPWSILTMQMALKLHPDKCKAKGGEEAFKKVSRAFGTLDNADTRAYYDRTGHENPQAAVRAHSRGLGSTCNGHTAGLNSIAFNDCLAPALHARAVGT